MDYKNFLVQYAGQKIPEGKKKDVSPDAPYKINLYHDNGHESINRAKVDLDRDNKWDEKWTFKESNVFSKSINSPFYEKELIGKVRYTISKGKIAEIL